MRKANNLQHHINKKYVRGFTPLELGRARERPRLLTGFTLLELLIVIGIIGILSSVTIVSYSHYSAQARLANTLRFAQSMRSALQDNMVAWWTFDETSGSTSTDNWLNGLNGRVYGAVWTEGIVNNALSFDGIDDYVDFGNPAFFPVTGNVTIAFWAYPSNYALRRQNPICKAYGGEFCMTMEPDSSVHLYYGTAGGNSSPYTYSTWPVGTLVNKKWVHLVWVKDALHNQVFAYKDGKIVQTTSCSSYCYTKPSSLNLLVGNGYAGRYVGLIDDVQIYNTALSADAIYQLYARGAQKHQPLSLQQ
jgi:prepilin-type N-terminal cleavage/methylation domain-containing protein